VDFLHVHRSIDELLYEAITWLVFDPRTMWRSVGRLYSESRPRVGCA
jgi:hypothetical protein